MQNTIQPQEVATNQKIDLGQVIEEFKGRAFELFQNERKCRQEHEKEVSGMISKALSTANENLQYLLENVIGFQDLLKKITESQKCYFGKNVVEALKFENGPFFCLRQFGFMNIAGTVSVGIHNEKIIFTSSRLSDEFNIIYDSPTDESHYKFLNSRTILMELERYNTPLKLLQALLIRKYGINGNN